MSLLLFISSLLLINPECSEIQSVRDGFHQIDCEESLTQFMSTYKNCDCKTAQPYLAAATMRKAEYCMWPGTKLTYFSHGKSQLENYIKNNEADIEGRYVRVLVQSQLPSFLGYNDDLLSDIRFIETYISESDLKPEYQATILKEISLILNEE